MSVSFVPYRYLIYLPSILHTGIEVPGPGGAGGSRHSTPVSMVPSHYDSPGSTMYDSPSMVPRNLSNMSSAVPSSPIVIQPESDDKRVSVTALVYTSDCVEGVINEKLPLPVKRSFDM